MRKGDDVIVTTESADVLEKRMERVREPVLERLTRVEEQLAVIKQVVNELAAVTHRLAARMENDGK